MLSAVCAIRWRGVALNFRSCSGEINRQPRFYHSGETSDLDWVVKRLIHLRPKSPLFLIGFSLGGNVLLKWLGEQGMQIDPAVRAAAAISVPFDLGVAAHQIDHGIGRLYGMAFLRTLKQKAIAKEKRHHGLVDPAAVRQITSYLQFDDQVTAPIHGFKDANDYWRRCSAKHFLSGIRRPTLIIHAKDDPFLPASYLPTKRWSQSKWLVAEVVEEGGHVGFIAGRSPWEETYWTESRTIQFLTSFVKDERKGDAMASTSF